MYQGFAQSQGWRVEMMSISETEAKGIKEVAVSVTGEGSFAALKYESGVHRVQRVRDPDWCVKSEWRRWWLVLVLCTLARCAVCTVGASTRPAFGEKE